MDYLFWQPIENIILKFGFLELWHCSEENPSGIWKIIFIYMLTVIINKIRTEKL